LAITLEADSRPEDVQFVREGLMAYNRTFVPDDGYLPLNIFLRTPDQSIVGGLLGETYWGWLHIAFLWLRDDFRRQGFGERLLAAAEAEAARRGCHAVNLDTLSFQALPFYTARGYAVFGVLEDHPPGHTRFFLRKELHSYGSPRTASHPP
jgi:GNAT superfamily N-acetyltransferase